MTETNWALARKREKLAARADLLHHVRDFFKGRGYLEVETPHRIPANAPEAHIDAVPSDDWALQTSPELAMKRLLAAGYGKLFQVCRVWRAGERGRKHLPEFTMLEWYRASVDYRALMTECMELFFRLVPEGQLTWQGRTVDLGSPWEELTVRDAFARYASLDLDRALAADRFDELLSEEIEPHLGIPRPTFLTEYPSSMAALARRKPGDPTVAERFELYIAGMELANAFSELTDPEEQRRRFIEEAGHRRAAGRPNGPLPEKFLAELAAMPAAAGIALGFDRLVMLLTDSPAIDEVVAFTPADL